MEYSAGTSWLQQQHVPDGHDGRTTTSDDWKETTVGTSGAGPSGVQPSMDLGDFTLDLSGEPFAHLNHSLHYPDSLPSDRPAAPSPTSGLPQQPSQSPYYSFPHHANYFLAGTPGHYNGIHFTQPTWPASAPNSHIPLSSYSSLNGATTSTSAPMQSPQQSAAPSPPPPQIMIECVVSYYSQLYLTPCHLQSCVVHEYERYWLQSASPVFLPFSFLSSSSTAHAIVYLSTAACYIIILCTHHPFTLSTASPATAVNTAGSFAAKFYFTVHSSLTVAFAAIDHSLINGFFTAACIDCFFLRTATPSGTGTVGTIAGAAEGEVLGRVEASPIIVVVHRSRSSSEVNRAYQKLWYIKGRCTHSS